MIPETKTVWQKALANLITEPAELIQHLELDPSYLAQAQRAAQLFPLRVTHSFVQRMAKGNVNDPLLRQVLPLDLEFEQAAGFSQDPLQEKQTNPVPGLLHKYHGRALITLTHACAIHCRYCFRRHFPYASNNPGRAGWHAILDYLRQHPDIKEVILSGGDPLVCTDACLHEFIQHLENLPHLKRLRVHSRLPIVLPERITTALIDTLTHSRFQVIMVIHSNHAREIDSSVSHAMAKLKRAHIPVLNQTVLLCTVNDNAASLAHLSECLFKLGVLPYYLHLPDKVANTTHFFVPMTKARAIHRDLQAQLPGYLVPRLVQEIAGEKHKLLV